MSKTKRKVSKGTGKRYEAVEVKTSSTPQPPKQRYPESSLRRRIERFTMADHFRSDIFKALETYFEMEMATEEDFQAVEEEFTPFFEWFVFDYVLSSGSRLIDQFRAEAGSQLSNVQREILDHWMANKRLRLLEVQEIEPGVRFFAKDLLNGERLELQDMVASQQVIRWEVLLARPEWSADCICLSPEIYPLRPRNRTELLETAEKLWQDYQEQSPNNSLLDFYRDHSLDLILAARRIFGEENTPLTPITEEGHEICFCSAYFDVNGDIEGITEILKAAEEFEFTGVDEDDPDITTFVWIKRGRSHIAQAEQPPAKAILLSAFLENIGASDQAASFGNIALWEKGLELNCLSLARLEAGKELLAEILGERIHYQEGEDEAIPWHEQMALNAEDDLDEDFDDDDEAEMDDGWEDDEAEDFDGDWDEEEDDESKIPDEIVQVQADWQLPASQRWLNESIPALKGLTPRQAAQDAQTRPFLIALLKDFEFSEAQGLIGPGGGFDLDLLRQELGITDEDMLA